MVPLVSVTTLYAQSPVFTSPSLPSQFLNASLFTGVSSEAFRVSSQEASSTGLTFSADGSRMFVIGASGDAIVEYNLSTAFDVSTAVYAGSFEEFQVAVWESNPQDLAFNTDGTRMFVIGATGDDVVEFDLSTAFDVSTA